MGKKKPQAKKDPAAGAAAKESLTPEAVINNPYAVPKSDQERTAMGAELYEGNLRELSKILAGPRGMSMVHLDSIGVIDSVKRCKVSDTPERGSFTIFLKEKNEMPLFGHTNMLTQQQAQIVKIMQQDATEIVLTREMMAHTASKSAAAAGAPAGPSEGSAPSATSAAAPPAPKASKASKDRPAAVVLEEAELEEDLSDEEMPSFEELLSKFKEEDAARQQAASGASLSSAAGAGKRPKDRRSGEAPITEAAPGEAQPAAATASEAPVAAGGGGGKDAKTKRGPAKAKAKGAATVPGVQEEPPAAAPVAAASEAPAAAGADKPPQDLEGPKLQIGIWVEACGLQSCVGQALNGRRGEVVAFVRGSNRFQVEFRGEGGERSRMRLKPENLRPLDARELSSAAAATTPSETLTAADAASRPPPTTSHVKPSSGTRAAEAIGEEAPLYTIHCQTDVMGVQLEIGDVVEAVGLQSEAGRRLNSRIGKIMDYIADKERFQVQFGEGSANSLLTSVRPGNLRKLTTFELKAQGHGGRAQAKVAASASATAAPAAANPVAVAPAAGASAGARTAAPAAAPARRPVEAPVVSRPTAPAAGAAAPAVLPAVAKATTSRAAAGAPTATAATPPAAAAARQSATSPPSEAPAAAAKTLGAKAAAAVSNGTFSRVLPNGAPSRRPISGLRQQGLEAKESTRAGGSATAVAPEGLEAASTASGSPTTSGPHAAGSAEVEPRNLLFEPNAGVEACNLQSDAGKTLNGRFGRVLRFVDAKRRYEVLFKDDVNSPAGDIQTLLKSENLRPADHRSSNGPRRGKDEGVDHKDDREGALAAALVTARRILAEEDEDAADGEGSSCDSQGDAGDAADAGEVVDPSSRTAVAAQVAAGGHARRPAAASDECSAMPKFSDEDKESFAAALAKARCALSRMPGVTEVVTCTRADGSLPWESPRAGARESKREVPGASDVKNLNSVKKKVAEALMAAAKDAGLATGHEADPWDGVRQMFAEAARGECDNEPCQASAPGAEVAPSKEPAARELPESDVAKVVGEHVGGEAAAAQPQSSSNSEASPTPASRAPTFSVSQLIDVGVVFGSDEVVAMQLEEVATSTDETLLTAGMVGESHEASTTAEPQRVFMSSAQLAEAGVIDEVDEAWEAVVIPSSASSTSEPPADHTDAEAPEAAVCDARGTEASPAREPEVAGGEDHSDDSRPAHFAVGQRVACLSDRHGWVFGTVLKISGGGRRPGYQVVLDDSLGHVNIACDAEGQIRERPPPLEFCGEEINGDFLSGLALGACGGLLTLGLPAALFVRHCAGETAGRVAVLGWLSSFVVIASLGYKYQGNVRSCVGQFLRLLHAWSLPIHVTSESLGVSLPVLSLLQRLEYAVSGRRGAGAASRRDPRPDDGKDR